MSETLFCRCCGKELLEGESFVSAVNGLEEVLCLACRAFFSPGASSCPE